VEYWSPLLSCAGADTRTVLGSWRRQMVVGAADEFAVIGTSSVNVAMPRGRRARTVKEASSMGAHVLVGAPFTIQRGLASRSTPVKRDAPPTALTK
jgi:hypothetical protein